MLSQTLHGVAENELKLFSPIKIATKNLAEFDYSNLTKKSLGEIKLYSKSIEDFFDKHRFSSGKNYISITPIQISSNLNNAVRLVEIVDELDQMDSQSFRSEVKKIKSKNAKVDDSKGKFRSGSKIFIGHGRSKLWARIQLHLKEEHKLDVFSFESESHTSESIVQVLEGFLDKSSFAILILTAEDETSEGKFRARQNVIHEAGLFQGRLGFDKVVILKQNGVEDLSNLAGLQYISFTGDNVEQSFYELGRKMKKNGIIK